MSHLISECIPVLSYSWHNYAYSLWIQLTVLCSLTGSNGEPKITHGNTLVSELSLEEVTQTINVRTIKLELRMYVYIIYTELFHANS